MSCLFLAREIHGAPFEAGRELEGGLANILNLLTRAPLLRLDLRLRLLCVTVNGPLVRKSHDSPKLGTGWLPQNWYLLMSFGCFPETILSLVVDSTQDCALTAPGNRWVRFNAFRMSATWAGSAGASAGASASAGALPLSSEFFSSAMVRGPNFWALGVVVQELLNGVGDGGLDRWGGRVFILPAHNSTLLPRPVSLPLSP